MPLKPKPIVSFITLLSFLVSQCFPVPVIAAPDVPVISPFKIELPSELGRIDRLTENSGPLLIHIQTAHGNYEAQKKIQAILHFFKSRYGIDRVFVEGSSGVLHPERLRLFPAHKDWTAAVADGLAKKALLKGVELFLIEDEQATAHGIEESEDYAANLKAFRDVLTEREKSGQFIMDMNVQIERLIAAYSSKPLRSFLKRRASFEANQLPVMDWISYLKDQARTVLGEDFSAASDQKQRPMLVRFMTIMNMESHVDRAAFEKERSEFLRQIEGLVSKDTYSEAEVLLHETPQAGASVKHTALPVFQRLVSELPAGFPYDRYPQIRLAIGRLILHAELDGSRLHRELNGFADEIQSSMAKTAEEKSILRTLSGYRLLGKLFALELTPSDYEILSENAGEAYRPSKIALGFAELNRRGLVKGLAFKHLSDLDELFEDALLFYRLAKERERHMTENVVSEMKTRGIEKAVVITGGFHAEPFARYFEDLGYQYALVSPSMTSVGSREAYIESILKTGRTPLRRSTLESPFVFTDEAAPDASAYRALAGMVSEVVGPANAERAANDLNSAVGPDVVFSVQPGTGLIAVLSPDRSELRGEPASEVFHRAVKVSNSVDALQGVFSSLLPGVDVTNLEAEIRDAIGSVDFGTGRVTKIGDKGPYVWVVPTRETLHMIHISSKTVEYGKPAVLSLKRLKSVPYSSAFPSQKGEKPVRAFFVSGSTVVVSSDATGAVDRHTGMKAGLAVYSLVNEHEQEVSAVPLPVPSWVMAGTELRQAIFHGAESGTDVELLFEKGRRSVMSISAGSIHYAALRSARAVKITGERRVSSRIGREYLVREVRGRRLLHDSYLRLPAGQRGEIVYDSKEQPLFFLFRDTVHGEIYVYPMRSGWRDIPGRSGEALSRTLTDFLAADPQTGDFVHTTVLGFLRGAGLSRNNRHVHVTLDNVHRTSDAEVQLLAHFRDLRMVKIGEDRHYASITLVSRGGDEADRIRIRDLKNQKTIASMPYTGKRRHFDIDGPYFTVLSLAAAGERERGFPVQGVAVYKITPDGLASVMLPNDMRVDKDIASVEIKKTDGGLALNLYEIGRDWTRVVLDPNAVKPPALRPSMGWQAPIAIEASEGDTLDKLASIMPNEDVEAVREHLQGVRSGALLGGRIIRLSAEGPFIWIVKQGTEGNEDLVYFNLSTKKEIGRLPFRSGKEIHEGFWTTGSYAAVVHPDAESTDLDGNSVKGVSFFKIMETGLRKMTVPVSFVLQGWGAVREISFDERGAETAVMIYFFTGSTSFSVDTFLLRPDWETATEVNGLSGMLAIFPRLKSDVTVQSLRVDYGPDESMPALDEDGRGLPTWPSLYDGRLTKLSPKGPYVWIVRQAREKDERLLIINLKTGDLIASTPFVKKDTFHVWVRGPYFALRDKSPKPGNNGETGRAFRVFKIAVDGVQEFKLTPGESSLDPMSVSFDIRENELLLDIFLSGYKPNQQISIELEPAVLRNGQAIVETSADLKFARAVRNLLGNPSSHRDTLAALLNTIRASTGDYPALRSMLDFWAAFNPANVIRRMSRLWGTDGTVGRNSPLGIWAGAFDALWQMPGMANGKSDRSGYNLRRGWHAFVADGALGSLSMISDEEIDTRFAGALDMLFQLTPDGRGLAHPEIVRAIRMAVEGSPNLALQGDLLQLLPEGRVVFSAFRQPVRSEVRIAHADERVFSTLTQFTAGINPLGYDTAAVAAEDADFEPEAAAQSIVSPKLADKAMAWLESVLRSKLDRQFGIAFDVGGDHAEALRQALDKGDIKQRIALGVFTRKMRAFRKIEGLKTQMIEGLEEYTPSGYLENSKALPALTEQPLFGNGSVFGVRFVEEINGEPEFEAVAEMARIVGGMLTAAEIRNAGELLNAEKIKELRGSLRRYFFESFKDYAGKSFVDFDEQGNLLVDRAALFHFVTEILARTEVAVSA